MIDVGADLQRAYDDGYAHGIADAMKWIPCSERLPEGITQVIIQTNGEAIHEAIYMGKDDYGHYVWKRLDNEIYWDEEVVAWMPLPTPYQPKEDICK